MAEKKRNLVVQWRDDGDWFVRKGPMFAEWSPSQQDAMRFESIEEFREYERSRLKPNQYAWRGDQIRFVRIRPRGASK